MPSSSDRTHEVTKFLSGLVAGDFLVALWLYTNGHLPIDFFGITIGESAAVWGMVFDAFLFLILVYYSWHITLPLPSPGRKTFFRVVGILLGLVAILHLLRLVFGIEIQIGLWIAPMWVSLIGTIVTGYLSYVSFHFARR